MEFPKNNSSSPQIATSTSVTEQLTALDNLVTCILLNPDGRDTHNILAFIRQRLQQFKLNYYHEECEVFLEAYSRAKNKISSGEPIECNMPLWLKGASFNIIREWKRDRTKQSQLAERLSNKTDTVYIEENEVIDYAIGANLEALLHELKSLKKKDYLILYLRIVEGRTWKEIGEHLFSHGEESEKDPKKREVNIRQKGKRLLERLRNKCDLKK